MKKTPLPTSRRTTSCATNPQSTCFSIESKCPFRPRLSCQECLIGLGQGQRHCRGHVVLGRGFQSQRPSCLRRRQPRCPGFCCGPQQPLLGAQTLEMAPNATIPLSVQGDDSKRMSRVALYFALHCKTSAFTLRDHDVCPCALRNPQKLIATEPITVAASSLEICWRRHGHEPLWQWCLLPLLRYHCCCKLVAHVSEFWVEVPQLVQHLEHPRPSLERAAPRRPQES